jgi:hypothetical protein
LYKNASIYGYKGALKKTSVPTIFPSAIVTAHASKTCASPNGAKKKGFLCISVMYVILSSTPTTIINRSKREGFIFFTLKIYQISI